MGPGGAGGEGAGGFGAFIPLILMFVIFYFLLIRPQQKKSKEALPYLRKSLELEPDHPIGLTNIIEVLVNLHNIEEAEELLKKYKNIHGDKSHIKYHEARIYASKGKIKKAIQALKIAVKINSKLIDYIKKDEIISKLEKEPEFKKIIK